MIKLLLIIVIAVIYTAIEYPGSEVAQLPKQAVAAVEAVDRYSAGEQAIKSAFDSHISDLQVTAKGRVVKVLADDDEGARHQRFILKLAPGITLLVAHNIDLAPRVPGIKVGDEIEFNGEYVWNNKGGVIHWTHHDPQGKHEAGWLRHQGQTYQ